MLASKKAQIWLFSYWFLKRPRYGCCPSGTLKSLDMVVVLLASQKSRHGCCPTGIFKKPDMVDVLLAFLNKKSLDMVVVLLAP